MTHTTASIDAIQLDDDGVRRARIACPADAIPQPGQYVQAHSAASDLEVFPESLFAFEANASGFVTAGPIPAHWQPGTALTLRGPLGKGFALPEAAQRVALVGLDAHVGRLAALWQGRDREAALFTDAALPRLPAGVEANPLSAWRDALGWADYTAIDVPLAQLPAMSAALGGATAPQPAEALVFTAMPCGGMAACGVCAVATQGKPRWTHACERGPVFALDALALTDGVIG